ncbi:MAG: PEP-CTERM sorting domain-containing protein [Opitutaceae bacterium]
MKLPTYSYVLPALAVLSAVNVQAATRSWLGTTDNDFSTASNWNIFPTGTHSARMQADDGGDNLTVLSGGNTHSMNAINVRGGHTLTIDNDGGTLTGAGNFNLGRGLAGDGSTVSQLAGSVVLGGLDMSGNVTGGDSIYTISGGSLTIGSADTFDVGGDGLGGNVGGGSDVSVFAIEGDSATVTVTNNVLARASSVFSFTLGATGVDAIDTTGNLTISTGASLSIVGAAYVDLGPDTINLFEASTINGTFALSDITVTGLGTEGVDWSLTQNAGGSGDIVLSIIPEPGTYALMAGLLGLCSVVLRRRR